METSASQAVQPVQTTGSKLHPVLWVAAIAMILLSVAGIGAIFGLIPTAGSAAKPAEPLAAAPTQPTVMPTPTPASAPDTKAPTQSEPTPVVQHPSVPAENHVTKKNAAAKPKAVAQAPAQSTTAPVPAPVPAPPPVCSSCGTIEDIRQIEQKGEGTGLGAVAGGVAGAVLGHQVGKGKGNVAATVIGGVGGAVAGHQVEKYVRRSVRHEVTVRLEEGGSRVFTYDSEPVWRIGDRVKIDNGVLVSR